MRIYLADLFHVYHRGRNPDTNPYTIPLGIGFLASTVKRRGPSCDVRLFRDPDKLLAALREMPPDVMGFSFCSWNTELSRRLSDLVKSEYPDVVTVAGGPSVDDTDEGIVEFLEACPSLDFVVPNEGESGFLSLLKAIEKAEHRTRIIPGVAYIDEAGNLVRGSYNRPVVPGPAPGVERISPKQVRPIGPEDIEIPSPYLDGTLDEFLDDGLVPIIQTMRGCPYQCHFCVSGATEWNRMRGFDIERVKAEIDYALSRSRCKDLILTDENWGILGERDIELARFIMDRHHRSGAPNRLYYYTAKIVTPASKEIVELVAPIAWIAEFSMSFQSLNPETRRAIKRTNIGMDKLAENIQWARERNITTSSEMIYGFPHEDPGSFFEGVEQLLREGVDRVTVYPLQLFPGIDLGSKSARKDYAFQTRFRLADCGYGVYDNGKLIAAEAEEIVIGNRWSSVNDYFTVRRYGFFQQLMLGRGYFLDLLRLCKDVGVPFESIIRKLTLADCSNYPAMREILDDHQREAEAELKASQADVQNDVISQLRLGRDAPGVKLNLIYLGRLMSSPDALQDVFTIIRSYFDDFLVDHPNRQIMKSFLDEVLPHRIVVLNHKTEDEVDFYTRFDYLKWSALDYESVEELLLPAPRLLRAVVAPELKENLREFDRESRVDLQGIFDKTKKRHLVRAIVDPVIYTVNVRQQVEANSRTIN